MSKNGRKRYRSEDSRGVLAGKRHISERPQEANLRLTIEVIPAAKVAIARDERQFKTLCLDNGTEFHDYAKLEQAFNLKSSEAPALHLLVESGLFT